MSTVMVFKRSLDGTIEPVSIESLGGIDKVMEQVSKANAASNTSTKGNTASTKGNTASTKSNTAIAKSNTAIAKSNTSNTNNTSTKSTMSTTSIKLSKSQFICTYLTDDTLIDFLMEETDYDFIIHYTNGKKVKINLIDIYCTERCDCINCRTLVINDDKTIFDKMSAKCYIEITLDNALLEIIAEKQFRILEIMTENIVQLPSSIPSYPTFLPPVVALPLPPLILTPSPSLEKNISDNFIDLSD